MHTNTKIGMNYGSMCAAEKDYAGAEDVRWFVMRAYKNEKRAEEKLGGSGGMEYFIPKRYAVRTYHGVKSRRLVPAIPSLVFVRATRMQLVEFKKLNNFLQFAMMETSCGQEYMTVPDSQMDSFIRISSRYESDPVYYRPEEIDLKKGVRVRILGGAFDGVEGVFVRVQGKRRRRIVVMLDSLLAVSAEVDPDLIEVLDK